MQIADEGNGLQFLELKIEYLKGKLSDDVHSKEIHSSTYVMSSMCYPLEISIRYPKK